MGSLDFLYYLKICQFLNNDLVMVLIQFRKSLVVC